jgi:cytochrome b6-f complex iron-sulfur subunit
MASVAGFFAFISLFRFSIPRSSGMNKRVKIGKPGLFPLNDYTYIHEHKLFIYRDNTGVKVVSSICTHLGCAIEKIENGFQCPCHGSQYDREGHVLSGPALKDLPWYRLYRSMDGQIIVDLTKTVDPDYKLPVL